MLGCWGNMKKEITQDGLRKHSAQGLLERRSMDCAHGRARTGGASAWLALRRG